jgi:SWI/SNF-related matrix-associated actin-dependent regulator 1 of chromatin subfamily A
MNAVVEWVNDRIEGGHKVVIAAHHREIVDALAAQYGNLKIQGGMDVVDVERNKQIFQEKDVVGSPVMVLSIQAAKTGHTLTASQDVLFVELPWTPSDVDQTYSRCHRLGQKGSVTATYLLCQGTIDEKIYGVIEEKRNVVNAATEGKTAGSASDSVFDLFMEQSMNQ